MSHAMYMSFIHICEVIYFHFSLIKMWFICVTWYNKYMNKQQNNWMNDQTIEWTNEWSNFI
jgi:hypothetical protein